MPSIRKGSRNSEEDQLLLQTLAAYGIRDWGKISHLVGTRTPKQCTERYSQHFKPDLDNGALSEHERSMIDALVFQHGTR